MFNTFYEVTSTKQADRNSITLGLARIGHNNKNVSNVYTFKVADNKYVVVTFYELPDSEELANLEKTITRFGDCEYRDSTHDLENLLQMAKDRAPNTKLRLWFDRATYV